MLKVYTAGDLRMKGNGLNIVKRVYSLLATSVQILTAQNSLLHLANVLKWMKRTQFSVVLSKVTKKSWVKSKKIRFTTTV